jgi:regulator of replication initiation timing
MIQDKLIEGAVNSYNIIAKRLIESLTKKETDIKEINQLYEGLKEHRKIIKRLFKENPSLEVYKPEIRKVLQDVRDNKDIFKKLPLIDEESISDYYEGIDYVIEINREYDLENFILRRMEAGAIDNWQKSTCFNNKAIR